MFFFDVVVGVVIVGIFYGVLLVDWFNVFFVYVRFKVKVYGR